MLLLLYNTKNASLKMLCRAFDFMQFSGIIESQRFGHRQCDILSPFAVDKECFINKTKWVLGLSSESTKHKIHDCSSCFSLSPPLSCYLSCEVFCEAHSETGVSQEKNNENSSFSSLLLQVLSLQTWKVFMGRKKLWKASVWRSTDRHCVNSNICINVLVSGDESLHFPWLLILRYPVQTDLSKSGRYNFCCLLGYLLSYFKVQSSVA